jgi:hypothetical protein
MLSRPVLLLHRVGITQAQDYLAFLPFGKQKPLERLPNLALDVLLLLFQKVEVGLGL